jgi:signal transduction histidine kinase
MNGIKFLKAFLNQDYESAKRYNDISASYMPNTEANSYVFKLRDAQIYFEQNGRFQDEQKIIEFADQMIDEEDFNTAADLYFQLSEGERKKLNLDKALEYKKKENELREKVLAQNADGQIFEMEIKYETEKKEAQLAQQKATILRNRLIIILLTLSLALLLTGFLIYNLLKKRKLAKVESQRQELFTNQLMENTEEERSRIANELHDSVNHELLTIKNNLSNGKNIHIEDISKVIEEVRNISRNLHPTILATIGFEASIEHLCEKLTESGLFTTCEIEYNYKLSKNKELQMYRIIQEALNNTLKHGKANAAKVILTSENNFLHLEIKDNGSGFNVQEELNSPKSFGLQSIYQRAKAILAKVSIDSNSKGTVILIKIPV